MNAKKRWSLNIPSEKMKDSQGICRVVSGLEDVCRNCPYYPKHQKGVLVLAEEGTP